MIELDDVSFTYRTGEADAVPALRGPRPEDRAGPVRRDHRPQRLGEEHAGQAAVRRPVPDGGRIRIDGVPVRQGAPVGGPGKVAVVFQDPDDQLVMNRVADDVAFGPENLGLPREEIEERVALRLEALGLEDIGGRLIEDLSPGQKQRVAIAGALAMRPRFLILDEPTSLLPVPVAHASDLHGQRPEPPGGDGRPARYPLDVRGRPLRPGGRHGRGKVMDGTPAEVFRRVEELREIGLDVPLAASLAHRLRSRGIPLEGDILNTADLRAALSAPQDSAPSG